VVGHGKRLFPDGIDQKFQLAEAKTFSSGVVMVWYQPAQGV